MNIKRFIYCITALTTIFLIIVAVFVFIGQKKYYLQLTDESGNLYLELPVEKSQEFSIEFIHSVNKTPVVDFYEIRKDGIYVTKTLYYGFGAGVQTTIEEGQQLSYTEDGGMLVSGFDKRIDNLAYVVGKVSDHILQVGNRSYSLRELCGRGSYVIFKSYRRF